MKKRTKSGKKGNESNKKRNESDKKRNESNKKRNESDKKGSGQRERGLFPSVNFQSFINRCQVNGECVNRVAHAYGFIQRFLVDVAAGRVA